LIFLTVSLLFSFSSCKEEKTECSVHTDTDADGYCDKCGKRNEGYKSLLYLIESGEAQFQFVIGAEVDGLTRDRLKELRDNCYEDTGVEFNIVDENDKDEITEKEILVGFVSTRGEEYEYVPTSLGKEGFAIMPVGEKIIISSGDEGKLYTIVEKFFTDYIGYTDSSSQGSLDNVSVSEDKWREKIQDGYRISSVSIDGEKINGYVIAAMKTNNHIMNAALALQDSLYTKAGIYLEIKDIAELSENELKSAIIVKKTENAGAYGFRVRVDGKALVIETEFLNKIEEAMEKFLDAEINMKRAPLEFKKNFKFETEVRSIYYNDFGAVGDGETNDYSAICDAHTYANMYGHTVCAGDSTGNSRYIYYIGATGGKSAVIKTDVDWGNATFIIDDSGIEVSDPDRTSNVFVFKSDYTSFNLSKEALEAIKDENGGLDSSVTKLNYAPGYDAMLIIYNGNHRQYIRYGTHLNTGSAQGELVVINGKGEIDPNTKILFDYEEITSVKEIRIDDKPITAKGGIFITIANKAPRLYTSYSRNLSIQRSNVTIRNIEHQIIEEGDTGAPYSGFISPSYANNLRVEDSILQAHKTYQDTSNGSWMGTYDIGGYYSNGLYFYNCTQSNFFSDEESGKINSSVWGIMGTNYCKNITYDKSRLSRLDAHAGVYNASIINGSEVQSVSLIGGGTATIEDSTIYSSTLITLRSDYGSLWQGDIKVKNVDWRINAKSQTNTATVISITYNNHDFGYITTMTESIVIEDLTITDSDTAKIYLFSDPTLNANSSVTDFTADRVAVASSTGSDKKKDENELYKNYNPVCLPKEIIMVDFSQYQKSNFSISTDKFLSKSLKYEFMTSEEYSEYLRNKE
jgi:hypothetical protein